MLTITAHTSPLDIQSKEQAIKRGLLLRITGQSLPWIWCFEEAQAFPVFTKSQGSLNVYFDVRLSVHS